MPFREEFVPDTTPGSPSVKLGLLQRIRTSAPSCPLCNLFDIILQRAGSMHAKQDTRELQSDELFIEAVWDYHGSITESLLDGDGISNDCLFMSKKLGLHVYQAQPEDETLPITGRRILNRPSILNLYYIAQACTAQASTAQGLARSEPVPSDKTASMLFDCRVRPQVIDRSRLMKWIKICEIDHEDICDSYDEVDE